ncbi:MAG TPA: hypothetical protein VES58_05615 [Syntrophobacteria bacterium]|nr:hypothetical protein [Syntrophobacteria bacterium]
MGKVKEIQLWEISLVCFTANVGAVVTAVKSDCGKSLLGEAPGVSMADLPEVREAAERCALNEFCNVYRRVFRL